MEVGDQVIDDLEAVARDDVEVAPSFRRGYPAGLLGGKFQGTDGGGAHRPDLAALLPDLIDGDGILFRDVDILLMDSVLTDGLGAHRGKGAVAHVQGDPGDGHSFFFDFCEQVFREMEAGSGSGHGPRPVGIDGLVAPAVLVRAARVPCDVGRQRDLAADAEDFRKSPGPVVVQSDSHPAFAQIFEDGTEKLVIDDDR